MSHKVDDSILFILKKYTMVSKSYVHEIFLESIIHINKTTFWVQICSLETRHYAFSFFDVCFIV